MDTKLKEFDLSKMLPVLDLSNDQKTLTVKGQDASGTDIECELKVGTKMCYLELNPTILEVGETSSKNPVIEFGSDEKTKLEIQKCSIEQDNAGIKNFLIIGTEDIRATRTVFSVSFGTCLLMGPNKDKSLQIGTYLF